MGAGLEPGRRRTVSGNNSRMTVLALISDGFGAPGGIAQYNRDLMTALSQSSAVRDIVALPRFGQVGAPTPPKVTQRRPQPGRLSWVVNACEMALQLPFDILFCGHLNAAPLAALIARGRSKPLWLQVHGIEAWAKPGTAIRKATARAHLITAVSRHTRARLLSWCDIDPARVRVLPNTVDARFHVRAYPSELASRYGLVGRKVILTVGRLAAGEQYKGHDRIIGALADVRLNVPEAVYLVVGSGDDQLRLEAAAVAAGVRDHVIFAGQVAAEDLPDHFRLADVFAMPSTGEGFGIVFLEAAASGLPVIAGHRDGSADALADGVIGTLIDPGNRNELVTALIGALRAGRAGMPPDGVERFAFPNFATQVDALVRHHFH